MTNPFSGQSDRVSDQEVNGIHLDPNRPVWEVASPRNFSSFVRALADLLPPGCIAYLEGGFPRNKLQAFLDDNAVPEVSHVHMGTICPRPQVHHIPATVMNLHRLADAAEGAIESEILWHFHVYQSGRVLLQWYDAFDLPMYISMDISEERVRAFCTKLRVDYKVDKKDSKANAKSEVQQ